MADASSAFLFRKPGFGKIAIPALIILFTAQLLVSQEASRQAATDTSLEELPGLRERAVVMRIISRIVEQDHEVVWNSENSRVTIPGRPVGLKLLGSNLVVAVQFTPYLRSNNQHILVAQGQIWINVPNEGIRYHTTMQTIPLEFSEQVYFFPLGSMEARDEAHIEIQLVMEPYTDTDDPAIRRGRRSHRSQSGESSPANTGSDGNPARP